VSTAFDTHNVNVPVAPLATAFDLNVACPFESVVAEPELTARPVQYPDTLTPATGAFEAFTKVTAAVAYL